MSEIRCTCHFANLDCYCGANNKLILDTPQPSEQVVTGVVFNNNNNLWEVIKGDVVLFQTKATQRDLADKFLEDLNKKSEQVEAIELAKELAQMYLNLNVGVDYTLVFEDKIERFFTQLKQERDELFKDNEDKMNFINTQHSNIKEQESRIEELEKENNSLKILLESLVEKCSNEEDYSFADVVDDIQTGLFGLKRPDESLSSINKEKT